MTPRVSELVVDDSMFPDQDDIIKYIVRFHLRELLRTAHTAEQVGLLTVKGALLDHPRTERMFIGSDALGTIGLMTRWPIQCAPDLPNLTQTQQLREKILEALRSFPEADILSRYGLTVVVRHHPTLDSTVSTRFTAWIRQQSKE